MAKPMSGEQAVPLEEVVLAQDFELEALMNVLERRGLITKAAVLEEIKRLRARTPEGKVAAGVRSRLELTFAVHQSLGAVHLSFTSSGDCV